MIHKNLKRTGIVLFSTIMLAGVSVPGISYSKVSADAVTSSKTEKNNEQHFQSDSELFNNADRYVHMDGNQYVLSNDAKDHFSSLEIQKLKHK